jgi:hypothetical protein
MAVMGLMTAARTLLIRPVLGRVLRPAADANPEPLFTIPVIHRNVYLEQFFPPAIHNIFTIVAIAIFVVFLIRGICDYFGDLTSAISPPASSASPPSKICVTTFLKRFSGAAPLSSKPLPPAK